jgi:hypothetical protein
MLDRRISFHRDIEKAAASHVAPRVEVIKDKHAHHVKPSPASQVEVQVVWQIDGQGLRRIVQLTHKR